jgi:hypothetical protein
MHAWFTPPLCSTPRDTRAQIASLYYTYAVDVLTDMMSKPRDSIPISLFANLPNSNGSSNPRNMEPSDAPRSEIRRDWPF